MKKTLITSIAILLSIVAYAQETANLKIKSGRFEIMDFDYDNMSVESQKFYIDTWIIKEGDSIKFLTKFDSVTLKVISERKQPDGEILFMCDKKIVCSYKEGRSISYTKDSSPNIGYHYSDFYTLQAN